MYSDKSDIKSTTQLRTTTKTLKDISPYIIKIILMTGFMYIDGHKQEIDEDLFDQMAEALPQPPNNQPTYNHNIHPMATRRNIQQKTP